MSARSALLYARIVLALGAIVTAILGITFLAIPESMAELVELELGTPLARGDIQTVYGGLELGLAVLILCWLTTRDGVRRALQLHIALWGGLAGGRAISLITSQAPLEAGTGLFATELIGLALGWSAWLVVRRCAD